MPNAYEYVPRQTLFRGSQGFYPHHMHSPGETEDLFLKNLRSGWWTTKIELPCLLSADPISADLSTRTHGWTRSNIISIKCRVVAFPFRYKRQSQLSSITKPIAISVSYLLQWWALCILSPGFRPGIRIQLPWSSAQTFSKQKSV